MKGKTQRYYDNNPKARAKKLEYDKEYQKGGKVGKKRTKYRAELQRIRREAAKMGMKIEGLDYDHTTGRFIPQSINRARTPEKNKRNKK